MWYFQSSFESSLLRFFCSMTLIPMTATLVFQHNAEAFLNTRVISGLEKNVIKYCPFLLTSDEIRTGTAKPSLLLPTNQYLLQHRRRDRGWKTRKPPFPMTIFLPQPCSSRCCWWRVNSSVLPEELHKLNILFVTQLTWTFYLLLTSTMVPLLFSNSKHGFADTSTSATQQRKCFYYCFYNCSTLLHSWIPTLKGD